MFEDRKDAGRQLAGALKKYRNKNAVVLAIPKGGAEAGCEVAKYLKADFSLIITRKLPFPDNPESGFGAVAEDGSAFIYEDAAGYLNRNEVEQIKLQQKEEIKRRIKVLRDGRPLPDIKDRTVIIVDDGVAMGSTMRASILLCRKRSPARIIAAAPVSSKSMKMILSKEADEAVILETPSYFYAVAQVYRNWYDVSDEEAARIMRHCGRNEKTVKNKICFFFFVYLRYFYKGKLKK